MCAAHPEATPNCQAMLGRSGAGLTCERCRCCAIAGNRGVGKTVVMKQLARHAEAVGYARLAFQASSRSTLSLSLQQVISAHPYSTPEWKRPLAGLQRVTGVSLGAAGMSASVSRAPAGPAPVDAYNTSAMAGALAELAGVVGKERGGGVVLCIDELQMSAPDDLEALGGLLNHLNNWHPDAHVVFVAAGLPNTMDRKARASSQVQPRVGRSLGEPVQEHISTIADDPSSAPIVDLQPPPAGSAVPGGESHHRFPTLTQQSRLLRGQAVAVLGHEGVRHAGVHEQVRALLASPSDEAGHRGHVLSRHASGGVRRGLVTVGDHRIDAGRVPEEHPHLCIGVTLHHDAGVLATKVAIDAADRTPVFGVVAPDRGYDVVPQQFANIVGDEQTVSHQFSPPSASGT